MELDHCQLAYSSSNKRIRLDGPVQLQLNITNLPIDVLAHIITFSSIEDYAFGVLLVSKYFSKNLSPYTSPFIIKRLINNECFKILDDVSPFKEFNETIDNILTPWREWILSGSYAWKNHLKIPRIHTKFKHTIWFTL